MTAHLRKNVSAQDLATTLTAVLAFLYARKMSGTKEEKKMAEDIAEMIEGMLS